MTKTKIGLMAAAALSLGAGAALADGMRRDPRTGLVHDKDGFVLRREGGPEFSGYSKPAPRGTTFELDAATYAFNHGPQKAKRKFKHNRRG